MLSIIGVLLIMFGFVLRDISLSSSRHERRRWRHNWAQVVGEAPLALSLGDTEAIARLVGHPDTSPVVLDQLAKEIAAHDWQPSDRLLDQLRKWAQSQIIAENALRPDKPKSNNPITRGQPTTRSVPQSHRYERQT